MTVLFRAFEGSETELAHAVQEQYLDETSDMKEHST